MGVLPKEKEFHGLLSSLWINLYFYQVLLSNWVFFFPLINRYDKLEVPVNPLQCWMNVNILFFKISPYRS